MNESTAGREQTTTQLLATADRLEGHGQYNLAKLVRAAADSLARRAAYALNLPCLLYTSPSPRDRTRSRMPSSA